MGWRFAITLILLKLLTHCSLKVNTATLIFLNFLMNSCTILYSDFVYLVTFQAGQY